MEDNLITDVAAGESGDVAGFWKAELLSSLSHPKSDPKKGGRVFDGHRWLAIFLRQARDDDPGFTNEVFRLLLEHDFPLSQTSERKRGYILIGGIEEEVAAFEDNQLDFPIFKRFLSCMPQTFQHFSVYFTSACPKEIFNWFPDEIECSSLKLIRGSSNVSPFMEQSFQEELPGRKGTIEHILYCCRFVEKLKISGFKASTLDPHETALPVFESNCCSLSISGCGFKDSSGKLLHERTAFPRLTSFSFTTQETYRWPIEAFRSNRFNELGMKDVDLFWSTWFIAAKSLQDLTFNDATNRSDLLDPDDPGHALFAAMCRAASDPLQYARNLTKLEIIGTVLEPVQLDNLRLVSKSLKHLRLCGCRVDDRFESILKSLLSLESLDFLAESLDFPASTESHSQYNSVLLKYFSKKPSSLKSLAIGAFNWISTEVIKCLLNSTLETLMFDNTFLFCSTAQPPFSTVDNAERIEALMDMLPTSSIRHVQIFDIPLNLATVSQMIDRADQLRSVTIFGLGCEHLDETESLVAKVETKPNLFTFCLRGMPEFHELQQRASLYCFMHRVQHSLTSSPIEKRGFIAHLLKMTDDNMGPNGIYMLLKEKLLEDE